MRVVPATAIIVALCLSACASGPRINKSDYSEIDVATVSGCDKPSMEFHELRDWRTHTVTASELPLRVKPGTYTIGIECAWTHDPEGACVDAHGNPELQVGPYALMLNPKIRYAFKCDLEGNEYVIRMSENAR